MSVLLTNEILAALVSELQNATDSVQIITAFSKLKTLEYLNGYISDGVSEKKLMVRFRLDDLIKGVTDFEVLNYALNNGWKPYIRFDLHAKTYIVDDKRMITSSANATGSGLGLGRNENLEMGSLEEIEADDLDKIRGIYRDAIMVDKELVLRLAVISGLLIVGGSPCVVIRKIPKDKFSLKELDQMGMFSDRVVKSMDEEEIRDFYISEDKSEFDILLHRMISGKGILFTGKGASGKTTLMNACLEKIPDTDSVMICQENAELFDLHHPDLIAAHVMVNGGDSKVSYNLGDLTRVALLVDLDRVIVGEVKEGSEAAGLSKASMTGHKCWTSVHGESCEMAVEKMADYISQATGYGNREALKQLLGFEYVVHLRNFRVDEIVRITGFDHEKGKLVLQKVYPFEKEAV